MTVLRRDPPQTARANPPHYRRSWHAELILTRGEANRLIQEVSTEMTRAGFRAPDIHKMQAGMEEAFFQVLDRMHWTSPQAPLHVGYRVSEVSVVVEIETARHCRAPRPEGKSFAPGNPPACQQGPVAARSFMTWIRYSKRDRTATLCDCQMIQ